jgi:hypothetical protein
MSNALIAAVKQHALAHYNEGGWDYVVECYEDDEIAELVAGATTEAEAIALVGQRVGTLHAYREDIRNA